MDSKLIITACLALYSASSQAQSFQQGNYQTDIRLINEHTLRFEVRPAEYDNLEHFSYHQPAAAPMVWNKVEQSDSLIVWSNLKMLRTCATALLEYFFLNCQQFFLFLVAQHF